MRSRGWVIVFAAAGALAGCAAPPTTVRPVETPAPVAAPVKPTVFEYPPIEPVEAPALSSPPVVPRPSETAPAPAPVPEAEPSAVPAPSAPSEPSDEQQLASLLSDLQRYGQMNPDEVRREVNNVTQLLARQRTDLHRVRLAVLYTLAKTPQDDQRALVLLEIVTKNNSGTPTLKQLASVLQVQIAERARALKDEQQKGDAAIKKLEALRLMERDLLRDRLRGGGGGGGGGGSSGGGGGGGGGGG